MNLICCSRKGRACRATMVYVAVRIHPGYHVTRLTLRHVTVMVHVTKVRPLSDESVPAIILEPNCTESHVVNAFC